VHGADINAVDDDGKTPLDWAIEVERLDVAESDHRLTRRPLPSLTASVSTASHVHPLLF
jgi:hypothetical protein